ncbi:predicted protein [Sclerotinia sclerotiorum 1980 UF-70]|uniref:Uncharacterized protein n=1 Tax=Sclerotinia sclerotiorum (strain ATCC 18683 / 1980 / Ss-1) TaxID=665079 RepID=A7F9B9_SCLS1|nr:predicted protein [Sclerotinia sclerotiorum 1980 UF-70]EDO00330.1 predicted protein [Sclerotinia sclerotiorum 1980 UF-70]
MTTFKDIYRKDGIKGTNKGVNTVAVKLDVMGKVSHNSIMHFLPQAVSKWIGICKMYQRSKGNKDGVRKITFEESYHRH